MDHGRIRRGGRARDARRGTATIGRALTPEAVIRVERLRPDHLSRIAEIDRSETVHARYRQDGVELIREDVVEEVPDFFEEGESHSVPSLIREWRPDLEAGGVLVGAFVEDVLAGIAMLGREVADGVAELSLLFVGRSHRRLGVANALLGEVERLARERGATAVYVSAVPSDSAVGFYLARGFRPVEPLPEPFAREPDDIHMLLRLTGPG